MDIITSYGNSGTSSSIIEIQARKIPGPPIVGTVYGDEVEGDGNITINGNDNCASSASVPAVAFVDEEDIDDDDLTSAAGKTTQITPALDLAVIIDELESTATVVLTGDQTNYSVGSSSNYEIVFCDATQLGDQELDINNITGHGTLVVRGDIDFGGTTNWNGLLIASGNINISGDGTIYGAVLAASDIDISGTVDIYYDSCELDNVKSSYRHPTSKWKVGG